MESVTSSSPSFPSNSEHSGTHQPPPPTPPPIPQNVGTEIDDRGIIEEKENPTEIIKQEQEENTHRLVDPVEDMDNREYRERYNKIEADYTHWLMAKYFSDKDIFGDSVFDGSKIINGKTIKTSRIHCAQSYADPVQYLKDKKSGSSPPAETQTCVSNAKLSMKEEK